MSNSTRTGFTPTEAASVLISESAPLGYNSVVLLSCQQELKPYRAVSGNGHLVIREI